MLNIIDAIVILVILFGAVMGFKHGFTKQLVSFIGLILIIFLAFKLKILYQNFYIKIYHSLILVELLLV